MFYDSVSCLKRPLSCVEFSEMVFFSLKYHTAWLFCDDLMLAMPDMAVRMSEDKLISFIYMDHLSK